MKGLVFLWLCLAPGLLIAQEAAPCGTVGSWSHLVGERLLAHKDRRDQGEIVQFRETQFVPVKFHLVAQNDGAGRVREERVLDQLCALNEDFAGMDIQFYIKGGFNYVDNSAIYEDHVPTINTIMTFQRDPESMNIWIVDDASPPSDNDIGITLGYYDPTKDWIVVNKDFIDDDNSILTHEIGHFFSLLHPHNGWDSEPYREEEKPAPATSPSGVPTERVDGSNGDSAGDFLPDTPADYNGLGIGCDFDLNVFDPDSTLIDPDETNFMSYFLSCPREQYHFSELQQEAMQFDLSDDSRDYLRRAEPGTIDPITEAPELLYPIDDERALGAGTVQLEWDAADGATRYIVQIARTADFSIQRQTFIATTNALEVTGLDIDARYFWRVRPYNDYVTCMPFTNGESFFVDQNTSVANTIRALDGWTVSPNPLRSQQQLTLQLRSTEAFEADIHLIGMNGTTLRSLGRQRIPSGASDWKLPVNDLSPGVYVLAVLSPAGRLQQRVVIVD